MRACVLAIALLTLGSCANENGRPGPVTQFFCGIRESACEQRCKGEPAEVLACRRSCNDTARNCS